jgi:hypothetical protein
VFPTQHVPESSHKAGLGQKHSTSTSLGEQYPSGPQSPSTRQLLFVSHVLALKSDPEARHSQGTPPAQSESAKQSSDEQKLEQAKCPAAHRPLVPAVHCPSAEQTRSPPSGGHSAGGVQPGPRCAGQSVPAGRCFFGACACALGPASGEVAEIPDGATPLPPHPSEAPSTRPNNLPFRMAAQARTIRADRLSGQNCATAGKTVSHECAIEMAQFRTSPPSEQRQQAVISRDGFATGRRCDSCS